jgi:hypothetical protein
MTSRLPLAVGLVAILATPAPGWDVPSGDRTTPDAALVPVGLRLTGQARREGSPPCQFEIVMHGPDCYYRKEWSGSEEADSGWWTITLILDDYAGYCQHSWSNRGGRRGGIAGDGGKGLAEVAGRLFKDGKLVGALPSRLRGDDTRAVEEYVAFCRRGKLLLPTAVRWVDKGLGTDTVYQVQHSELLFRTDKEFFAAIKKKHFR